ncbi:hypothetical protein ACFWPU_36150 [Streptomyces sp. NPDC058471]|uniref:hypothetical protein n=1 Tax=Streptomyces sp. NPDC058471 TaxID=3346516 RepID=UPI0036561B6E
MDVVSHLVAATSYLNEHAPCHRQTAETSTSPDRALTIPARDANPAEGCLLAVGPSQVRAIAGALHGDQRNYAKGVPTYSPWWLRTVSYFGADAQSVGYDAVGDDVRLKPGTAGGKDGFWWGSSICNGKPALHTLTVDHLYSDILGRKALSSLFRAYVDGITTREYGPPRRCGAASSRHPRDRRG